MRPTAAAQNPSARGRWLGSLLLALAAAASLVLAFDHLGVLAAPGCGAASACAELTRGPWGTLPGLEWPTAFLGTAWFAALLVANLVAGGVLDRGLRLAAVLGVLGSLVFVLAMIARESLCPWCLTVHAANLAWYGLVLRKAPLGASSPAAGRAFLLTFALASAALAIGRRVSEDALRGRAESDLARTQAALRAPGSDAAASGFTGRWRLGPEAARARVVLFTDYQCPDCRRIETELDAYAREHADAVSVGVRYFPMCSDCNPHAPTLHPNACWAARAAESAGRLGGSAGFWRMHRWLFARAGAFTKPELEAALPALGFDVAGFVRELNSAATLSAVEQDVAEAMRLGLTRTPLLYVNGVELRGWHAPDALRRTLDGVLAAAPPAARADGDRPPDAREKILGDWRAEAPRALAPDAFPRRFGAADAEVVIVLFGDYQDEFTAAADTAVRTLVGRRTDLRYEYRHFPTNQACNPAMERTIHPLSCLAALGAEAAAQIGEEEAFWTMHEWLMTNPKLLDDATLAAQAERQGIAAELWWEVLKAGELSDALFDDVAAAREAGVESIPALFVDGKWLARWQCAGEDLLPVVVEEALRAK